MKSSVFIVLLILCSQSTGAVQEGSLYPDDAFLISDTILEYLGAESVVSFSEVDSSLVLFIALGGKWYGNDDQWTELIIISSYTVSLDLQRSWDVRDIAVSFGDTWCRLPMDRILEIADNEHGETDSLDEFKNIAEIHSMN